MAVRNCFRAFKKQFKKIGILIEKKWAGYVKPDIKIKKIAPHK